MNNTDLSSISSELFKKIANRYHNISMLDKDGKTTTDEREAVIFNMMFLRGRKDTLVTINLLNLPDLELTFDRSMVDNFDDQERSDWFNFVSHELRRFTVQAGINLNIIDLDKKTLSTNDIQAMIEKAKKEKEDIAESRFSRLSGTLIRSIQVLERHRIKVKHTDIVNDDIRGSRSRKIKALYIENNQNERRKFPFLSLEGVRAMARHLEEGGDWNDRLGQRILETTKKSVTIRGFIREVRRQRPGPYVMEIIEQLRERRKHYRRELSLISGSNGYRSFKENIEECYVEPISSIEGHFSNMPASVLNYLPQIERILGEKIVTTLEQEVLKEYVNWVNGSLLVEAPQEQPAAQPAAKNKMPVLQVPKLSGGVKGVKQKVDDAVLKSLGIVNAAGMLDKEDKSSLRTVARSAASNRFSMPVIYNDAKRRKYFFSTQSPIEKTKLLWLLTKYPEESKNIEAIVVPGDAGDESPDEKKSFLGKAISGYDKSRDVLSDPLAAVGRFIRDKIK